MPKIKTSDLTGAALDWAVAKCEGAQVRASTVAGSSSVLTVDDIRAYLPSTDWAEGGPIIERENIAIQKWLECGWLADKWNFKFATGHSQGSTPLIAAMRCYVASKLGDDVEIPEEISHV